jgi:hypothetical protein
MYNGREGMSSLIPSHQLEKALDISHTMHYLVHPSLAINLNNKILAGNLLLREDICDIMEKIVFPYFLRDDPLVKGRQLSLSSFSFFQLSKNLT